jgi:hypothetical protein
MYGRNNVRLSTTETCGISLYWWFTVRSRRLVEQLEKGYQLLEVKGDLIRRKLHGLELEVMVKESQLDEVIDMQS